MHFTREPIIETIITPKEGNKLLIRSSKGVNAEEFSVEALEVVSFGHAFFYRSLEKKCFLVPVTDYEVIEVKDTKIILKNIQLEKSIKIGGGKEAARKHTEQEAKSEQNEDVKPSEHVEQESRLDRKRDRRRNRRKRGGEEKLARQTTEAQVHDTFSSQDLPKSSPEVSEGGGTKDEAAAPVVSSSMFSALIPPPATLISETLNRYREKDFSEAKGDLPPRQINSRKKKQQETNLEPVSVEEKPIEEEKKSSAWDLPILPPPDDEITF